MYEHICRGTCSRKIYFDIIDNKVRNVRFVSGCDGNTQGIARLAEGMDAAEVVTCLRGIDCNGRGTSCPDQLARGISQALEQIK